MTQRRDEQYGLLTVTLLGSFAAFGFGAVALKLGIGFAVPVGIAAAVAGAAILTGPLGKAIARHLELSASPRPDPEALQELAHRVEALEQAQARLAELEERLDFTERLLVQQRDAERLGER